MMDSGGDCNCMVNDDAKGAENINPDGIDVTGDHVDAYPEIMKKFIKNKAPRRTSVPQYKDDLFYNTNHPRRGIAVIFNHEKFDLPSLKPRTGTDADCENLYKTLRDMEFQVHVHKNFTFKELDAALDDLSAHDFTDYDCLLIAVLSHGEQNVIYAKNTSYTTNILFDRFTPDKCQSLAGKPKLFVIQACQGDKLDPGLDVEIDKPDSGTNSYRSPLYADFLFAYSTIPGYYSWRNTQKGSWFIQAFCSEMSKYWKEYDFASILAFVNRRVAYDFESNVPGNLSMHRQKQISSYTSQLTRLLKFKPKAVDNGALMQ